MPVPMLSTIQQKVRRLTRSPSVAQLTDADLNNYINTFILYDIPSELRLFSLRTTLNFYTQPGVDVYPNNVTALNPLDPLFNFKNKYITIHPQVYMAGVAAYFTQYRDIFYGLWPQTNAIVNTGLSGNGTIGPFTGIVNSATNTPPTGVPNNPRILQKSLIFTCLATSGQSQIIIDYPQGNLTGLLGIPNQPDILTNPYGSINYLTGQYTFNFPLATAVSSQILPNPLWVEYVPYIAGKPTTMLYFNNEITIRPVPNQTYLIQLEADIRPTELLQTTDVPQIEQWWQYIAYGAAIKICQDRMDLESVNMMQPEFRLQQNLVNRTSLIQTANMSTKTVFNTPMKNGNWNGYNWPM